MTAEAQRTLSAVALLRVLNAELLRHDSATLTLERWCVGHGIGAGSPVVARRVAVPEIPLLAEQQQRLAVSAGMPIRYRRVQLWCADVLLSEADNWYVPGRLSEAQNRLIEETDIPFGRALQDVHFRRHTVSARVLWYPLPGSAEIPLSVLEHRAVLSLPDGTPLSEVVETYTRNLLQV